MGRYIRMFLGMACVIAIHPVAAYAQASIAGTVADVSGGVLPGVTVRRRAPH